MTFDWFGGLGSLSPAWILGLPLFCAAPSFLLKVPSPPPPYLPTPFDCLAIRSGNRLCLHRGNEEPHYNKPAYPQYSEHNRGAIKQTIWFSMT